MDCGILKFRLDIRNINYPLFLHNKEEGSNPRHDQINMNMKKHREFTVYVSKTLYTFGSYKKSTIKTLRRLSLSGHQWKPQMWRGTEGRNMQYSSIRCVISGICGTTSPSRPAAVKTHLTSSWQWALKTFSVAFIVAFILIMLPSAGCKERQHGASSEERAALL